jgi:hypothetical protein
VQSHRGRSCTPELLQESASGRIIETRAFHDERFVAADPCTEKPGLEVLLALVRPFPPRSKRDVVVTTGTTRSVLHAETSPAGTALILPIEATAFTTGPWQGLKELAVTINDPEAEIRGVISLEDLAPALAKLLASCRAG